MRRVCVRTHGLFGKSVFTLQSQVKQKLVGFCLMMPEPVLLSSACTLAAWCSWPCLGPALWEGVQWPRPVAWTSATSLLRGFENRTSPGRRENPGPDERNLPTPAAQSMSWYFPYSWPVMLQVRLLSFHLQQLQ